MPETMSILDLTDYDVNDSKEPVVADADEEAELQIVAVKMDEDKNGAPYILPRFEIVDDPYAKEFTRFFRLPNKEMNEKQLNTAKNALKKFGEAFDIDFTGQMDINDMVGKRGWAILGVSEDEEYGEQNFVKRFTLGS